MLLDDNVRVRVEPSLKREANAIIRAAGLDMSTAIRLFLRRVVETGRLPIDVPRANPTTVAAIRDARAGRTRKTTLHRM